MVVSWGVGDEGKGYWRCTKEAFGKAKNVSPGGLDWDVEKGWKGLEGREMKGTPESAMKWRRVLRSEAGLWMWEGKKMMAKKGLGEMYDG